MFLFSDLPPYVFGQILGHHDASYLVIRLWLCGDPRLNTKLSKGLTTLTIVSHFFCSSPIPRLISELHQLRHLLVSSEGKLAPIDTDIHSIIKTWPSSLESITLCFDHDFDGEPWECLESTFPKLQSLIIGSEVCSDYIPPSFIPKLPTSLTLLKAPLLLHYANASDSYLSKLPRGLLKFEEFTLKFDEASIDVSGAAFKIDLLNAPPGLEVFHPHYESHRFPYINEFSSLSESWLPRSLTEVDWCVSKAPYWCSEVACSMPVTTTSLRLLLIHVASYAENPSAWITELPSTLTRLEVAQREKGLELTPHAHLLPPGLTELSLMAYGSNPEEVDFGGWSTSSGRRNFWPTGLVVLALRRVWIEASSFVDLPRTLRKLEVWVNTPQRDEDSISTKLLPPALTDLHLTTNANVWLEIEKIPLITCVLKRLMQPSNCIAFPEPLPASLTHLDLAGHLFNAYDPSLMTPTLPNLKSLLVGAWRCDWLDRLPRTLEVFETDVLTDLLESELAANGLLFSGLPSSLKTLEVQSVQYDYPPEYVLPPQRFDSVPSLQSLVLAIMVESAFVRSLPRTLTELEFMPTELDEIDLPYLPPRLSSLFTHFDADKLPALVPFVPLASLVCFHEADEDLQEIARERVQHIAKHQ